MQRIIQLVNGWTIYIIDNIFHPIHCAMHNHQLKLMLVATKLMQLMQDLVARMICDQFLVTNWSHKMAFFLLVQKLSKKMTNFYKAKVWLEMMLIRTCITYSKTKKIAHHNTIYRWPLNSHKKNSLIKRPTPFQVWNDQDQTFEIPSRV